MKRISPAVMIAAYLSFSFAANAAAQFPTATPEQQRAGTRVVDIRFGVEELVLQRGDTVDLQTILIDASGNTVSGAVAVVFAQGVGPTFSPVTGPSIQLYGGEPGQGQLRLIVMVPEDQDQGGFFGQRGAKVLRDLPVRVLDWAAARIDIAEPRYAAYVGTSIRMSGQVMTDHGTRHRTAAITWRSSNSTIASVTPGGIVTLRSPGTLTVHADTENGVSAEYTLRVDANPVRSLSITPTSISTRTGDVVPFTVVASDEGGRPVTDVSVDLSVAGLDVTGAFVYGDGTFVAEEEGAFRVVASVSGVAAAAVVEVTEREQPEPVQMIAHGARAEVSTSDLWVFEGLDGRDYAYTGTHARGGGERMFVWDVTDPANLQLLDSVVVNARVVNDVKVSDDASWAIITREGASDRRNGIVVLDLADPAHPSILSELTDSLTAGIHNVWIEGDIVYAINDGTSAMNIIDMSEPSNPRHAGRWELRPGDSNKSLHDVWAEDGYAYLSYWDDGLVILDIGAGTHGGRPTEPTFVSQISYPAGNTHVAWRDRDYVFLGDEIGTADGMRGYIHVVDVSDIDNPVEVAKYDLPEAGAHNIWVEDETLYIAYYQGGLRVVDVSGTLRGDLYRQGREIGMFRTSAAEGEGVTANSPMAWGPHPYKGFVFVSDMNSGLWVMRHGRPRRVTF